MPVACLLLTAAPLGVQAAPPKNGTAIPPAAKPAPVARSPWSVAIEAGLGYDSNAYLAPSEPYIDFALDPDPTTLTTPIVHSGVFIPAGIRARYDGRGDRASGLIANYAFDADIYPDSETGNADEYNHRLSVGLEKLLNKKGFREDTLAVAPYLKIHDKTYYDRDTGVSKVSNLGTDLSDRYSYRALGVNAELDHETAALPHKLRANFAKLDYDEPKPTLTSYDHTYYLLGGDVDVRLARRAKMILSYDYYVRDYDERQPRDLSGSLTRGATREYVYNTIGVSLRNSLSDHWVAYLDYALTDRRDDYVGYNDYTQDSYGLRVIYDNDQRVRVRARARWWQRDYDNAFAFDDPTQARMTYDAFELVLRGDYKLEGNYGLWAEYKSWDQDTTDLRYRYDRYQAMIGVRWEK
jgi:hypothetical protein